MSDESGFTTAMRGYNREEVDRALQELRREVITANGALAEAQREVRRLSARVDELDGELEEVGSPTYSGLGHRLESLLRLAEEQSTRVIAQADIDAERLRSSTQADVDRQRVEAADLAERLLGDARDQSESLLATARAEADDLADRADQHAAATTEDALREAAWADAYDARSHGVDVYVGYLRQKIDEPFHIKTIHTIRAVGYMFSYEEK